MKVFKLTTVTILSVFCITSFAFSQTIEVQAGVAGYDLVDGLAAINGGAPYDTLVLVTDGGIYEFANGDTISVPITIMAAAGLTNKPIIRASAGDTCEYYFEVWADFTLEGLILDGMRTDGTLNAFTGEEMIVVSQRPDETWSRYDITFRDCEMRNVYAAGVTDPTLEDGQLFDLQTDAFLGKLIIEGTIFSNVLDEVIIMQNAYKTTVWGDGRAADTVIVRNCTFINCGGPKNAGCFTIKGDDDITTLDAKIILENLTFYNSGPNCIYARECEGMEVRNIVIANTLEGGDNDQLIRTDRDGSVVSHIDTFAIGPLLEADAISVGPGSNTGAGMATLDTATIYGFDPMFADPENGDLMVKNSELYTLAHDGGLLGDRRWADPDISAIIDYSVISNVPKAFSLSQNYPNPFNPTTTIKFALKEPGLTTLKVYNILGHEVATLVDKEMEAGWYEVILNNPRMASGVYIYQIKSGNFVSVKKMILMK